jgi:hypothetical protein
VEGWVGLRLGCGAGRDVEVGRGLGARDFGARDFGARDFEVALGLAVMVVVTVEVVGGAVTVTVARGWANGLMAGLVSPGISWAARSSRAAAPTPVATLWRANQLRSLTHSCHPGGAGGQSGAGRQPDGGNHPSGGGGQFGGGL